jgi:hypothetical protein
MGKDYHAKGQTDGAANKYDPPIDPVSVVFRGASDTELANDRAYKSGYENAKKQR